MKPNIIGQQLSHSQNFLKSPERVLQLLDRTSIKAGDLVYDIGAGTGTITEALRRKGCNVIGIEIDKGLHEKLQSRFQGAENVKLLLQDFLTYHLPEQGDYKIFSNIPFNLTADIIRKITTTANPAREAYFIIQRESVLKFAGKPYYKESQYSLLLKPMFELSVPAKLQRSDFEPQPAVDIVLLEIKRRERPLVETNLTQLYRDFVVYGYNQWKPTLLESLRKLFTHEQFKRLSKDLKFDMDTPTSGLTFEQWLGLFQYFSKGVSKEKQSFVLGAEQHLKSQQKKLHKIHRTNPESIRFRKP